MRRAYLTILSYAIISSSIAYFLFFPRPLPYTSDDHLGYYLIFMGVLAFKLVTDIVSWRLRCFFISKISGFYKLKGDLSRLIKYIGISHFPLIIASFSIFLIIFDVLGISLFFAILSTMIILMYMLFLDTIRSVFNVNWKKGLVILIVSELILFGIGLTISVVASLTISDYMSNYIRISLPFNIFLYNS